MYVCLKYAWILCILFNTNTKSQFVLTNLTNNSLVLHQYVFLKYIVCFAKADTISVKILNSFQFIYLNLTFIPFCDILRQISKQEWHFTLICVLWHFALILWHFASKVTFCVKFATFRVKSDISRQVWRFASVHVAPYQNIR